MAVMRRCRALGLWSAVALAVVQLAGVSVGGAQDYAAILAAGDRSDADRQTDTRCDALKLITFIGSKTGWQVLDMGAGAGYSTELMARAVGPSGKGWGQNDKASERFETRLTTPAMSNAAALISSYNDPAPGLPPLDLITFLFAYHDTTFMEVDRVRMNKALFAAPGRRRSFGPPGRRRQCGEALSPDRGIDAALRARGRRFQASGGGRFPAQSRRSAHRDRVSLAHQSRRIRSQVSEAEITGGAVDPLCGLPDTNSFGCFGECPFTRGGDAATKMELLCRFASNRFSACVAEV